MSAGFPAAAAGRLPLPEIVRILAAPLIAVALFVVAFFGVLLPEAERQLVGQKKATIATLTRTGRDVLVFYDQQSRAGRFPVEVAKDLAVRQLRQLRYGPEGKDYFWINDLRPAMVMHPYRSDLEGRELSDFSDPAGKRLFVEFVEVAGRDGAGYVEYQWQWQDDPENVVPKLSYVELFQPWGWIIGTGVYLEDVRQEIATLTRKIVTVSAAILLAIVIVSALAIRQGLRDTKRRLGAEAALREHQEQLEAVVAQRTADLQQALASVKQLSGFLPICASCKKIRDDRGYWNQIESYIRDHSEAQFSHGFCPECARALYPGYCGGGERSGGAPA